MLAQNLTVRNKVKYLNMLTLEHSDYYYSEKFNVFAFIPYFFIVGDAALRNVNAPLHRFFCRCSLPLFCLW